MKHAAPLILFLLLFQTPSWAETYDHWVANCRSYKDVAVWLSENFRYDPNGSGKVSGKPARKQLNGKGKEEIFRYRTGCSLNASLFAKETLNRINPDYRANLVHLSWDRSAVHYLCGFYVGQRLYIMDYWNPQENLRGTHGPFEDLKDCVQRIYLRHHPGPSKAIRYAFGMAPGHSPNPR